MTKRGFNIRIVLEWFYAVVTLERWMETLPHQIGLDVESGDATNTPIGYEEIYYSSGEASGETRAASQAGQKMTNKSQEEIGFSFFVVRTWFGG